MTYMAYTMSPANSAFDVLKEVPLSTRLAQGGIVGAAAQVFARLGFAGTRVEDILEAAGVARRTFYKYFSGKEDVLAAVYDLATSELVKALRRVPLGEPLEVIGYGLDIYLDYHVENGALLKVLVEQAIRSDSPLAEARRRFREEVANILDTVVRASTGEANDPMLYLALISALEGLSLDLVAKKTTASDVKRAKEVMHLLARRVLRPASMV
jgi:AcrR family transcriptional regulator